MNHINMTYLRINQARADVAVRPAIPPNSRPTLGVLHTSAASHHHRGGSQEGDVPLAAAIRNGRWKLAQELLTSQSHTLSVQQRANTPGRYGLPPLISCLLYSSLARPSAHTCHIGASHGLSKLSVQADGKVGRDGSEVHADVDVCLQRLLSHGADAASALVMLPRVLQTPTCSGGGSSKGDGGGSRILMRLLRHVVLFASVRAPQNETDIQTGRGAGGGGGGEGAEEDVEELIHEGRGMKDQLDATTAASLQRALSHGESSVATRVHSLLQNHECAVYDDGTHVSDMHSHTPFPQDEVHPHQTAALEEAEMKSEVQVGEKDSSFDILHGSFEFGADTGSLPIYGLFEQNVWFDMIQAAVEEGWVEGLECLLAHVPKAMSVEYEWVYSLWQHAAMTAIGLFVCMCMYVFTCLYTECIHVCVRVYVFVYCVYMCTFKIYKSNV